MSRELRASRTARTSRSSTCEYASGTIAHLELSWLSPSKLRRTAIVGSEKMVVYDDTSNEPVRIFDSGAELRRPGDVRRVPGSRIARATSSRRRSQPTEPLALEISDFCAADPRRRDATLVGRRSGSTSSGRSRQSTRSLEAGGAPMSLSASSA